MENSLLHKEKNLYSAVALSKMPRKILQSYGSDSLTECILYELSQHQCLDISMVAYFCYSPAFGVCHGVSGIDRTQLNGWQSRDIWDNIDDFGADVAQLSFSQNVKETRMQLSTEKPLSELLSDLESIVKGYSKQEHMVTSVVRFKNDNVGIFVHTNESLSGECEYEDGFSLLGFCPLH